MKLKRRHGHGAEVPTHSLNDIMFFLLLFFLIMSTLVNPNVIKILVASSVAKPKTEVKNPKSYELLVTAEKEYLYNNAAVDKDKLINLLVSDAAADPEMMLGVRFDETVDIQELVDILSACKEKNIKYVLKNMQ